MSIRTNTNPRARDVAPQLQSVLNANGMQAHISMTETGNFQLVTMSHNSSQPRYYNLTNAQVEALKNGGTSFWDKEAYNTFVSIVKNDYYIPASHVAARNANSLVNMGLNGHRLNVGEYGYMGQPRFRPFEGPGFGRFDHSIFGMLFGRDRYHVRRINDRPFFANSAPVVLDRPDGRLKPGELKTGSYGFYDKGNQQQDVLNNMKIESKSKVLERPKGQAERLSDIYSPDLTLTPETFQHLLATHGVVIDENKKTLTIMSSSLNINPQYDLKDEEIKKLMAQNFKNTGKKGNKGKDVVTIDERLAILNKVIENDFRDKITRDQLNTKDYVSIRMKPEVEKSLFAEKAASKQFAATTSDIIDFKQAREDYRSGFVDKWNSIGVVDGRTLNAREGFYLPGNGGRAVSVGEIQAYPSNDGTDRGTTYKMTAVINEKVFTHDISKEDYIKFLNYDDEYRLKLFDKNFKEVEIKSSKNGGLQDSFYSDKAENSQTASKLNGQYSFSIGGEVSTITSAAVWKDEVSGNYMLNVRDDRDAGMWSFKITEGQYQLFKNSTDAQKAQLLATMIPWKKELEDKVKVVESSTLQNKHIAGQNTNLSPTLTKALKDLDAAGIGYEIINKPTAAVNKENVQHEKEVINLNDLREQTRINLLGDAQVNGESLNNLKESKEWKRAGEHGRATSIGDITVEKMQDANGKQIEGKYKMSAVIDGNVISHEINQKQYDKFLAVNDYQRMKLFDKIFPEVEMRTKEGHGFNLGAAILAAVTTGVGVVASLSAPPRPRPEIYETANVYHKPGVVSPQAVSAALYESMNEQHGRGASEGMGMGR